MTGTYINYVNPVIVRFESAPDREDFQTRLAIYNFKPDSY